MTYPKSVRDLIEAFERLPGIGGKTAARLTFYLLHVPDSEIKMLGESVSNLKTGLYFCSECRNISDSKVCKLCDDPSRDNSLVCVVENPLDVYSLETTGRFSGRYFVLHGVLDPLHNIGPDELYIADFIDKINRSPEAAEVILAFNPTMEGEATAIFLKKRLEELNRGIKITRLGVGMPIGGDLQYADEMTLGRALEGRREY